MVWRSVDLANNIAFCTALRFWETPLPVSPATRAVPLTSNERPDREVVYGVQVDAAGYSPWVLIADFVTAGFTVSDYIGASRFAGAATDARIARITVTSAEGRRVDTQPKSGFWFVDLALTDSTEYVTVTAVDARGKKLYESVLLNPVRRP